MKKSPFFTLSLLSTFSLFAQIGKVGVNTIDPQNTLHINGDVRIDSTQENKNPSHILVMDDNGVIQKTKTTDILSNAKIIAVGTGTKKTPKNNPPGWVTVIHDKLSFDNEYFDYNQNTGEFTVKKEGYYFINGYCKIAQTSIDEGSATYQIAIDKNSDAVIRSDRHMISRVNNVDIIVTGTVYYEVGSLLRVQANLTKEFNVPKGNSSIIYLGDPSW